VDSLVCTCVMLALIEIQFPSRYNWYSVVSGGDKCLHSINIKILISDFHFFHGQTGPTESGSPHY